MTMEALTVDYRKIIKGRRGEDIAAEHLLANGYRIVERNYRCRQGEIDIIATDKAAIVFIEVKTRSSDRFGLPASAVDHAKQGRMARASMAYMADKGIDDKEARFDVVSVVIEGDGWKAEVIKDAFEWEE